MHFDLNLTQVVVAFITGLPPLIAAVLAAVLGLRNSRKIDQNTQITVASGRSATDNAKSAARAAVSAENKIGDLLNGAMDEKIRGIVKEHTDPLQDALKIHYETLRAHAVQDEKNMEEIRLKLDSINTPKQ